MRQAVVYIDEPADAGPSEPIPATPEEMFAEMEPYMVDGGGNVDDSREAIYQRQDGE